MIDHGTVHRAMLPAARPLAGSPLRTVLAFEVLSSTEWNPPRPFAPTFFVDVTATMDRKVAALLQDPGIIRNRLKVAATIGNARSYLALREEGRTLSDFLWDFMEGQPQINHFRTLKEVPASTPVAEAMSKALKKRGFKFVGPTIVYAFMQATGMVNDHLISCPRHRELL